MYITCRKNLLRKAEKAGIKLRVNTSAFLTYVRCQTSDEARK